MYSRHDTGFSQSLIDDVSCISDTETKTVTTASILYVGKAANVSVDSHHMSTMQPWTATHQTAAGEPLQSISYTAAACGTDLHVIDVLDSAAHTHRVDDGHAFLSIDKTTVVRNTRMYSVSQPDLGNLGNGTQPQEPWNPDSPNFGGDKLLLSNGTRSSAIAEGPRDASCQLKSCQLPRNSAETTCMFNRFSRTPTSDIDRH